MSEIHIEAVRHAVSKVMDLPLDVLVASTPLEDIGVDSIARIIMVDAILESHPSWVVSPESIKFSKTIFEFSEGIDSGETNG